MDGQKPGPSTDDCLDIVEVEILTGTMFTIISSGSLLTHLTTSDIEANYMAAWMAQSFSKSDAWPYICSGKTYMEDPEAHRLFLRAMIDRGVFEGTLVTNRSRTGIRFLFAPGHPDRRIDPSWTTSADNNWRKFLVHCGGEDAYNIRLRKYLAANREAIQDVYGLDEHLQMYRTSDFAVHPDFQGRGIGLAIHRYIEARAKGNKAKWVFLSMDYNVPLYKKWGCKIVDRPIPTFLDAKGRESYPPGNDFIEICEVNCGT